jgi:hypothetical protein
VRTREGQRTLAKGYESSIEVTSLPLTQRSGVDAAATALEVVKGLSHPHLRPLQARRGERDQMSQFDAHPPLTCANTRFLGCWATLRPHVVRFQVST